MLRRRVDRTDLSQENDEKSKILLNNTEKTNKDNVHSVSSLSAVVLIIISVLLFDIIVKIHKSTPTQLKIADEANHPGRFIGQRAQNHLKQLSSIGPKVTGSYENEVLAVDFLKREINFVIQQANYAQSIELDHQIVSGAYFLDFKPHGLVNIYENVQNVVARIASATNSSHSLLINCHFDSVPTSPGASDDGINCVAMLEVLRVLSRESRRPEHNIIFLFNGAEENPLQAAHGFITQHKWAPEVRAVINLEASGSGGREILFQAGPGNDFLIRTYAKHAPHPFAQSVGEELFQSNLIPSDTDFRLFRDFGHIPGLDFAFAFNGYVYHTKYDDFKLIESGSYQHVGDNLLAIVKGFAASPELPLATLDSDGKYVYFDVLGYYIIAYSDRVAFYINIITAIASVLILIKQLYDLKQSSLKEVVINMFFGGLAQIIGMIAAFAFVLGCALFLDQFHLTMSWYTRPRILFGLYFCPTLILTTVFLVVFNKFVDNVSFSVGTRTQIHAHATRMIWTVFLLLTTFLAIRSSYVFLVPVLYNTFSFILISFLKLHFTRRMWLNVYLMNLFIPTVCAMYQTTLLLQLFIPISARFGSNRNPDDYIGILSAIGCILCLHLFIPLVTLIKKPTTVIIGLLMTFLITLFCIFFTSYGFPYDNDVTAPSPQRFWVYHTNRVFHDETGNVRKQDSGYFLLNMDRNSPKSLEPYLPELENAISIATDCEQVIYCGLPIYTTRMLAIHKESTWIPAPPPILHEPVHLKLINKTSLTPTTKRYSFRAIGPDHFTIFISPKLNVSVTKWSFLTEIPAETYEWQSRPTYFIMYGYGEAVEYFDFWIDVETSEDWDDAVMDVVISGKYIHHEKTRTVKYSAFLAKFPDWTHATAWMANYHSWIY